MALAHSPSLVLNDIVLYYDAFNTASSWIGQPTTNLLPSNLAIFANTSGWSTGDVPGPVSRRILYGQGYRGRNAVLIQKGTAASGGYFQVQTTFPEAVVGGTTYTAQIKYKRQDSSTGFAIGDWGGPDGNNPGWSTILDTQFDKDWRIRVVQRLYTNSASAGFTFGVNSTTPGKWLIFSDFQLEKSTVTSSFTVGTRSNTQAILDLSKNNIITPTNISYASNNTFSFTGSSYLSIPNNAEKFNFDREQTIIIWMKNEAAVAARRNPYNQAYGGAGTITHESNTNLNYYYGTSGVNNTPYTSHGSPFSVVNGETAMIAITRDPANTAWYKNGTLSGTRANPYGAGVVSGTSPILIGTGYTTGFIGNLNCVMVYNRALSEYQIAQNFDAMRNRYGL